MLGFLLRFTSLFALSLWVGGGAAISFLAAPAVFEAASSRQQAGDIVGRILRRFELYVLIVGPIAAAAVLGELSGTPGAASALTLKLALICAMIGLALYSRFAIFPEVHKLREAMGNIDQVPADDRRRKVFGRLHGLSVLCLLGELLFGALAIALTIMAIPAR
jgi:uncharacterized membrane protein